MTEGDDKDKIETNKSLCMKEREGTDREQKREMIKTRDNKVFTEEEEKGGSIICSTYTLQAEHSQVLVYIAMQLLQVPSLNIRD